MIRRIDWAWLALILVPSALQAQPLPGTEPWDRPDDPAAAMVAGIHRFLDRETAASVIRRPERWRRDLSSPEAYAASIGPNRDRFARRIGLGDPLAEPAELQLVATVNRPVLLAETGRFRVSAVRWPVYDDATAEGLLLEPTGPARAAVVVIGDADTLPEALAGLAPGLEPEAQTARRLVEAGCRVLVPTLLDRTDEFSGDPKVRFTNLTHREWVYRMAYETGRHVIGYEVDAVRAGLNAMIRGEGEGLPVGVAGHGEGGLIAFYAAAVDPRIDAAWVGGSFGPREGLWSEPIDRNVWALLDEFGDAEIATLIAPRALVIEACRGPEVDGPLPPRDGRSDAAAGRLTTPDPAEVRAEAARRAELLRGLDLPARSFALVEHPGQPGEFNRGDAGRRAFLLALLDDPDAPPIDQAPVKLARDLPDPRARMGRLVRGWVDHTQRRARTSELRRAAKWADADPSSPEAWSASTEPFRREFWDEVIGRFPPASEPMAARSTRVLDEPGWTGYAVELPVWPDVVASGVLLLPKDLKPGERRPVVVCQHGLEGTPGPIVDPRVESVYRSYGAKLADLGYIVYAPQNPYIGRDDFRDLQRKAQPLKRSLFAVIVRQHERTLQWLKTLPNVDPARIAFYGLSYGGKTAMRVPSLLPDYCLSICSADFNEWIWKCTDVDRPYSYMYTIEHDMYEFGLSEGFNYAEMAALIAPRPFMVERGHDDGVAPDERVAYEYAKVRRLYAALGIADRTEIEFFAGGHMIRGEGTFAFLARHLGRPRGD